MLEFFLALFGGTYYAAKISGDRATQKACEQRSKNRLDWQNGRELAWAEQVRDRALEEDLTHFIADPLNYDAVWEEVRDAYSQMPSHQSFTRILLHEPQVVSAYGKSRYTKRQRENIVASARKSALDIMLARRGKVRYINTFAGGLTYDTLSGEGEHSKKVWDERYDMWLYLQNELRRHGVNARAIFKCGSMREHEQTAYGLEDVEQFHYKFGRFTWLPLTFFDDELHYVR